MNGLLILVRDLDAVLQVGIAGDHSEIVFELVEHLVSPLRILSMGRLPHRTSKASPHASTQTF